MPHSDVDGRKELGSHSREKQPTNKIAERTGKERRETFYYLAQKKSHENIRLQMRSSYLFITGEGSGPEETSWTIS